MKYFIIFIIGLTLVGCSTTPSTPEQRQRQHDDLDIYMLSHGHYIPDHQL